MAQNKPRLRNLAQRQWGACLGFSLAAASLLAVYMKIYVVEARKKSYIEFYKNWDDEKEFNAMKKAGLFKGFEA